MPRHSDHTAPSRKKSPLRLIVIGAATIGMTTAMGVAGAQALTAIQAQHFIECFGWMLTDPDVHAQNCLPGHMPPPGSLVEKGEPPAPEPEPTYTYTYQQV